MNLILILPMSLSFDSTLISSCHLVSVQWKRLHIINEPPAARAYHSMNCVGSRYLLFGGFDGKSTYGDLWWLVPEGITSFPFIESSRKLTSLVFDSVVWNFLHHR